METVANLWWLWLITFVLSGGYVMVSQAKRVGGMFGAAQSILDGDPDRAFARVKLFNTANLGMTAAGMAVAAGSGILTFVSLVINVVNYLK